MLACMRDMVYPSISRCLFLFRSADDTRSSWRSSPHSCGSMHEAPPETPSIGNGFHVPRRRGAGVRPETSIWRSLDYRGTVAMATPRLGAVASSNIWIRSLMEGSSTYQPVVLPHLAAMQDELTALSEDPPNSQYTFFIKDTPCPFGAGEGFLCSGASRDNDLLDEQRKSNAGYPQLGVLNGMFRRRYRASLEGMRVA